jgi:hypothetical protein
MKLAKEKITLEYPSMPDKIVVLELTAFDTDIDVDELTNIHYHNIIGEILTFPVVMNRVGNLRAEMEQIVAETKLDFDIFEAGMQEKMRKKLTETIETPKGPKVDKPTKDEVENAVLLSPEYKVKKLHLFKMQRNLAYVEALYWSAQSKDSKLNRLSEKLKPEEFEKEILETSINGIIIKVKNKSIKG